MKYRQSVLTGSPGSLRRHICAGGSIEIARSWCTCSRPRPETFFRDEKMPFSSGTCTGCLHRMQHIVDSIEIAVSFAPEANIPPHQHPAASAAAQCTSQTRCIMHPHLNLDLDRNGRANMVTAVNARLAIHEQQHQQCLPGSSTVMTLYHHQHDAQQPTP